MVVGINEDVAAASLLTLHDNNIEDFDKHDIFTNIEFEYIVTSIKKCLFHQPMIDFVNKLELSDQRYQNNINVIDKIYKGGLLCPMK